MRRAFLLASLGLRLLGCGAGTGLGPGITAYETSRYPEAIAEFERLAPESVEFDTRTRTRYALYRGLTHLALGNATQADAWLARAQHAARARWDLLTPAETGRLDAAWASLGHMPGDPN